MVALCLKGAGGRDHCVVASRHHRSTQIGGGGGFVECVRASGGGSACKDYEEEHVAQQSLYVCTK